MSTNIEKYAANAKQRKAKRVKKGVKEAEALKRTFVKPEEKEENIQPTTVEPTPVAEAPKKRGRKKKEENTRVVEVETDGTHIPRKRAPRGSKPIKKTFIDLGSMIVTDKVVYRILNEDGTYVDDLKEYDYDITFMKHNKINGKTTYKGIKYKITDLITAEKNLVFVVEPFVEEV